MSHCISYLLVNKYVCVCVCVCDLTEATRQRRTFDTAAILSVGLNDLLNGADVSHLEVLCDFLQVQSLDRCVAFWFTSL